MKRPLAVLLATAAVSACTTTQEPRRPTPRPAPRAQAPEKAPPTAEKPDTSPKFSVRQVIEMTSRIAKPENPVTPQDEQIIGMIKPGPAPASVEEAVLAIMVLRANAHRGEASRVVEENMLPGAEAGAAATPAPKPSLEDQMREKGVNFPQALASNPLLRNIDVFKLTARALRNTTDATPYRQEITDLIKEESSALAILNENETAPSPAPATPAAAETTPAPKTYGPGDFARSDTLLTEAQRLADRGEFKSALAKAQQVGEGDPYYGSAKEQIKRISNRAVQDLRQKAAQAFQSALPLTQTEARADYLEKARGYLNQALTDYPDSDQLGTVKDNLGVITRNLEALKRGESPAPGETQN